MSEDVSTPVPEFPGDDPDNPLDGPTTDGHGFSDTPDGGYGASGSDAPSAGAGASAGESPIEGSTTTREPDEGAEGTEGR